MARFALLPPLLPLLCAGLLDGGTQEAPPPADLSSTLELMWATIGPIVRSAVERPIAELDGRLTGLQVQLSSVGSELEDSVKAAEAELNSRVERAEAKLEARVQSAEDKLKAFVTGAAAELEERVESAEAKLEARLESAEAKLETRMDTIQSEQAAQAQEVTDRLNQLSSSLPGFHSPQWPARDCSDLPADAASGVYLLQLGLRRLVPAYCDQDTDGGGWTVVQRRADIEPRQDFYLGWEAYKWGFGELDVEFWWGLQNLWLTTSLLDRRYQIRFDLEDFDGERRYAVYQGFRVASEEDGYRLAAANYTGNAGDSFKYQFGQQFSTKDRDQDSNNDNCARRYKGAWWYNSCHDSNLNGLYLSGNHSSYADGVDWLHWRGHHYSLKSAQMKIKPSKKL